MKKQLNIALSSDYNYLFHCFVTIYSVLKYNNHYNTNFYILHNGSLNKHNIDYIKNLLTFNKYSFSIYLLDTSDIEEVKKIGTREQWTIEPLLKIFLPNLLPNLDKILYIDSDIIIKNKIDPIWDQDITNYMLVASYMDKIEDEKYKHINGGTVLINLKKARNENFVKKCTGFMIKNKQYTEEAALRILYNHETLFLQEYIWNTGNKMTIPKNLDKIIIIHYTSRKPWSMCVILKPKQLYAVNNYFTLLNNLIPNNKFNKISFWIIKTYIKYLANFNYSIMKIFGKRKKPDFTSCLKNISIFNNKI